MTTQTLKIDTLQKKLVVLLVALLVISAFSYVYLINQAVYNVVTRKQLEESISILGSQVSKLEFSYITQKNQITLKKAYKSGFFEPERVVFVSASPVESLTLNR